MNQFLWSHKKQKYFGSEQAKFRYHLTSWILETAKIFTEFKRKSGKLIFRLLKYISLLKTSNFIFFIVLMFQKSHTSAIFFFSLIAKAY